MNVVRAKWRLEGPIDGSYSLAIVNRELAKALCNAGIDLALTSRDGPGERAVDPQFLLENPSIAKRLQDVSVASVVLRNQYPPFVDDMTGEINVLANYGWEESSFPQKWIAAFNRKLDLILVPSRFVAKTLRDNGCEVPIRVVGYGADHAPKGFEGNNDRKAVQFRTFLHISSGFPRKSVDVLLKAWTLAFTSNDPVKLVLKTFPNPHNQVEEFLTELRTQGIDHAPIQLINDDIPDEQVALLFDQADVVVCPSRGEGFGLPLAECLFIGKPVITTAFGGQTDFCLPSNSWLCNFSFERARTHLASGNSIWANPDKASLANALKLAFNASEAELAEKGRQGQALIKGRFTWKRVASESIQAIESIVSTNPRPKPRIGWLSTWNSRCGIADYSRSLFQELDPSRFYMFADKASELLQVDEPFVVRCWNAGKEDELDEAFEAISSTSIDAIVLQFNFGFFNLVSFGRLVERLSDKGVDVFVFLHSTMNVTQPDRTDSLASIRHSLAKARRLLVHSVSDMNRLKEFELTQNATLFPFGLPSVHADDRDRIRRLYGLTGHKVIASFGYLLPNKGLRELIHAFAILHQSDPTYRLLLLNALYPIPQSAEEYASCLKMIDSFKLGKAVTLSTSFREEEDILAILGAADIIVYPYQNTQESASAAVRLGLASLTPVACTPLAIFEDVSDWVRYLPGRGPLEIAEGLREFFAEGSINVCRSSRAAMLSELTWPKVSLRLKQLIQGEFSDRTIGFRKQ